MKIKKSKDMIALANKCIIGPEYDRFKIIGKTQTKIFENGNLIYSSPSLKEIAEYSKKDLETIWDEIKRIDNPHRYFVDLSQNLWNLKQELLHR